MWQTIVKNQFLIFILVVGFLLSSAYFTYGYLMQVGIDQGYAPIQPIHYSHKIHAGANQIECKYCHSSARVSKHSGIPSLNVCMNCHEYIAEYNGELAIIDFKSSKKPKPRKWIDHYFVQCAAYACMLYELTNIPVKKFVILMSCENGECVVYEEYNKKKYIKLLSEYIREFVTFKLQEYGKS